MKEAKRRFWEMAKTRVRMHSAEEHAEFHAAHFPKDEMPTSTAFVMEIGHTEGDDPEKGVLGLEISVNKDFFGEENTDLIPYAIEHEIYEAWVSSKRGLRAKDLKEGHLLARMHQVEMAMKDGKAEKLLNFYISKNKNLKEEFEEAYEKAKKKILVKKSG
ncbi:MAG: hypothetical protein Q8R26_03990 [bacterium]|nr:hypothetical protein [bacterium]